jgi:hypothetical protein
MTSINSEKMTQICHKNFFEIQSNYFIHVQSKLSIWICAKKTPTFEMLKAIFVNLTKLFLCCCFGRRFVWRLLPGEKGRLVICGHVTNQDILLPLPLTSTTSVVDIRRRFCAAATFPFDELKFQFSAFSLIFAWFWQLLFIFLIILNLEIIFKKSENWMKCVKIFDLEDFDLLATKSSISLWKNEFVECNWRWPCGPLSR